MTRQGDSGLAHDLLSPEVINSGVSFVVGVGCVCRGGSDARSVRESSGESG